MYEILFIVANYEVYELEYHIPAPKQIRNISEDSVPMYMITLQQTRLSHNPAHNMSTIDSIIVTCSQYPRGEQEKRKSPSVRRDRHRVRWT
jgi:hypothetical protein